ncbi:hypothetical protein [Methylocystis silviterrae]|uniref:hypothetical protein n=1 Tax=Methylocystis silviterrae TaxID=2743612 RepID=UPI001582F2CC|nr:hypothetical protein [Methylocystis silviterrae]
MTLTARAMASAGRFSPLGPVGIFVFFLSGAGKVSTREIIKIRLVSFVTIFLLRDFKPQRPGFDQSSIWLSPYAFRPINAARFLCHLIAPVLLRSITWELAMARSRVKGLKFQTETLPCVLLFWVLNLLPRPSRNRVAEIKYRSERVPKDAR